MYWDPQERMNSLPYSRELGDVMINLNCQVDEIENQHGSKALRQLSEKFSN